MLARSSLLENTETQMFLKSVGIGAWFSEQMPKGRGKTLWFPLDGTRDSFAQMEVAEDLSP
jgi:hypothetical protein